MPVEPPPTSWPDASPVSLPAGHDETPTCSAPPTPLGPCPVCPRLETEFEPWRQAAYWQAMHQRAVQREKLLHEQNEQLQARIRSLEQQLFGRKADSPASADGPALRATASNFRAFFVASAVMWGLGWACPAVSLWRKPLIFQELRCGGPGPRRPPDMSRLQRLMCRSLARSVPPRRAAG